MTRIELWTTQLKVARLELKIRAKDLNAAQKSYLRMEAVIKNLERKIDTHLAQS